MNNKLSLGVTANSVFAQLKKSYFHFFVCNLLQTDHQINYCYICNRFFTVLQKKFKPK